MKRLLWAAAALLSAGLAVLAFRHYYEWSEEARDLGYTAAARRNPYLAAGRFLERQGLVVTQEHSLRLLDALPPTGDVLFVPRLPAYLEPERAARLKRWIADGGHLVTVYARRSREQEADEQRPFLEGYGLRRWGPEAEEAEEAKDEDQPAGEAPATKPGLAQADAWQPRLTEISFEGHEQPLRLDLGWQSDSLEDAGGEAEASGESAYGTQLLHYEPGQGALTVLLADDFLKNGRIADFDHALFLQELVDGRRLWLVQAGDYPALPALLARRYPEALLAATVLLALWLWQATARFGPVRAEPPPARRSLREHLAAAGRFHWRQDRGEALLLRLRAELEARILHRHGAWPQLAEAERLAWLAAQSRMPEDALRAACFAPPPRDELNYLQAVRCLQILRSTL